MIFSPRISLRQLAQLCRRLAIAYQAGLDARSIWAKETQRARGALQRRLKITSQSIAAGESLSEAFSATGNFFPPLFSELVAVAEQTGKFDTVFTQLAEHYHQQLQFRRQFLASITWPLIQLAIALGVIGLLIWIMGFLRTKDGTPIDLLGWGLYGNTGLAIYLGILAGIGLLIAGFFHAARRGMFWIRPVQRLALRLPGLGGALQKILLARLAWTLSLALDAGMEIRRAVRLSLRSTNHATFLDSLENIDRDLEQGHSLHEAFTETRCFPRDFLDVVAVGEESGRLVESLALQTRQYREQAQSATATLTMLASVAVWALIAVFIIIMIFQLAPFYFSALGGELG